MAKKKSINSIPLAGKPGAGSVPAPKPVQRQVKQPQRKQPFSWSDMPVPVQAVFAVAICVITWLFLAACLDNQFTNWDDPGYIKDNAVIKDLSFDGIQRIFSLATPIMGNYHPLTILTLALDYHSSGLDPFRYHLDSLLFHIVVTLLVYVFVAKLTHRPVAAIVASLLFGLHPMHVESVAWVAGRKDVVYGMFYVAALIAWLSYLRATGNKRIGWMLLCLLLFACSLLSKPVAVVLPLALFLIDYFDGRPINVAFFTDKIPFFVLSLLAGVKSLIDQHAFGSLDTLNVSYSPIERTGLGGYAFITYLLKAVAPTGLCCFYPYPEKLTGSISAVYYVYPLIAIAALVLLAMYMVGTHRVVKGVGGTVITASADTRAVVFGVLFFLVNIVLLLQFVPVGGAILADRYSYIPYLGLFIVAGWGVSALFEGEKRANLRYPVLAGVVAYTLVLGYQSHERCHVWYDTESLWADEIEKEPTRAPNAYNNLGFSYFNKFNDAVNNVDRRRYYDSASYLLNKAISLQPSFVNPYISLGELERTAGNFPAAKQHYYKALSMTSFDENANAYLGLAIIYAISNDTDSSAYCFRTALKLRSYFPEAQSNFGNLFDMMHRSDSALVHYGLAISQNPDMYAPYLNRGRLYHKMHRCDEAMKDFEKALQLQPGMGEIYYARSFCYAQAGDDRRACEDINKARSLGFTQINPKYYEAMCNGK